MSPAQAPVAPPRDAPTRDVPTRDVSVPSASDAGATAPARPAARPRPRAMIPGIGEPVDLNAFRGTPEAWAAWLAQNRL